MLKGLFAKLKNAICQSKFERGVSNPADLLREAISIMDESGRGIPGGSVAVWESDWKALRRCVYLAYEDAREKGC